MWVRRNRGGGLETAAFTVAVSHLDAIERKPLYHVRPDERVLTVAGPGCTFRCNYCVNHRLSQYGRVLTAPWTGSPADPAALVARAVEADAPVGLSCAEPSLALELTVALADHAGPARVPLLWKSNGFLTPAAVAVAAPRLEAVNIDVKAATEPAHQRLTGAPLAPVWDTIEALHAAGVWVEVSTPLIPGVSAEPDALAAIARRLTAVDADIPWHLVRFTPDFRMRRPSPTSPAELRHAARLGNPCGTAVRLCGKGAGRGRSGDTLPGLRRYADRARSVGDDGGAAGRRRLPTVRATSSGAMARGRNTMIDNGSRSDAVEFVDALPDLINAAEYDDHPDGRLVRVELRVTSSGVDVLGDAFRPAVMEALLRELAGPTQQMLCG
ncbi:radical SAM protein [Frankia gtarii]|uniref:radical SAM protein n=1 Tax=Frankia gtarii TaxID=2950102 RepID=UPI0021C14B83|nr:radical SAM protein [Frankia gtarii]